ncbi:hypothetical protein MCEMRE182_01050 [Candidatus Nanopelagicaceae bacterium]
MRKKVKFCAAALILISPILPARISSAQALTVSATGTTPAICNQNVDNTSSVTAERLSGGDCLIEFKRAGTTIWTAPAISGQARVLVLGGGGGGGAHVGSGGGAGGLVDSSTATFTSGASVSITVGDGGVGGSLTGTGCSNPAAGGITGELRSGTGNYCNDSSNATRSSDGGFSRINGGGTFITALGGGGGGNWNYFYPHSGGSGAGNSHNTTTVGAGTTGQGFSGGAYVTTYGAGGGGGAGGAGGTGSNNQGGTGGTGLTITGLGNSRNLAGGGGGGTHDTSNGGNASFGGGAGSGSTAVKAASGSANTCGGGGGTGNTSAGRSYGGDGGSGIVLIRYTPFIAAAISAPSVSGNLYKGIATDLVVTVSGPGKVRFFQDGKKIANCLSIATTGSYPNYTATCRWKPTVSSRHSISAAFTSSDVSFESGSSVQVFFWVLKRTTTR